MLAYQGGGANRSMPARFLPPEKRRRATLDRVAIRKVDGGLTQHGSGTLIPLHVIDYDGKLPLLGTGLLENQVLHVDYVNKELTTD